MIKIERKTTEKSEKAVESLKNAEEKGSTYNTKEVMSALFETFHGKCYICEANERSSYQIDHLVPHRGDKKLKYDWNNLYLSCAHCNNIKSDKYDPIIDCTEEEVDELIAFRKVGWFGTDEKLEFTALEDNEKVKNTVRLLYAIHYGTTPQKEFEAKALRRRIRTELSQFKEYVREYDESDEEEEKEDLRCLLKKELSERSEFTAFKRWLIRDNGKYYPELLQYISG